MSDLIAVDLSVVRTDIVTSPMSSLSNFFKAKHSAIQTKLLTSLCRRKNKCSLTHVGAVGDHLFGGYVEGDDETPRVHQTVETILGTVARRVVLKYYVYINDKFGTIFLAKVGTGSEQAKGIPLL
jgi:hypothetical protein